MREETGLSISLLTAALCTPAHGQSGNGSPPCTQGVWESPLLHDTGGGFTCASPAHSHTYKTVNALHLSVIPKGPKRGWLLVWDHDHPPGPPAGARVMFYALVDPTTNIQNFAMYSENFCQQLTPDKGDLFCAGHAWTANGNLLVVGGTGCHEGTPGCPGWGGSKLAYLWEPPTSLSPTDGGTWIELPDLDEPRWYPSVVAMGPHAVDDRDRLFVSGGLDDPNGTKGWPGKLINSYQVFEPSSRAWDPAPPGSAFPNTFAGPQVSLLSVYPRTHLLTSTGPGELGRIFIAGMERVSNRISHYVSPGGAPLAWHNDLSSWGSGGRQSAYRDYGSSVLLPLLLGGDECRILSLGGRNGSNLWATADNVDANAANPVWAADDSMAHKRWYPNTVLLPDTRVLAVGGESQSLVSQCSEQPALIPEIYDGSQPAGSRWSPQPADAIIRDYHSTAALLPSGKVITAGGDSRAYLPEATGACAGTPVKAPNPIPTDYRVFVPDYIACGGVRPVIDPPPGSAAEYTFQYGGTYPVSYAMNQDGVSIAKVVLMRPGSVTHHADPNQRCVELNFIHADGNVINVILPTKQSGRLPRGYYMMFFISSQTVTTQGIPSEAAWVHVS